MRWPWGDATWQWRCHATAGGGGVCGTHGGAWRCPGRWWGSLSAALVVWPQEHGVAWTGEGTLVLSWWPWGSGAGPDCRHLVLAACVAAASPAAMLLVLLPAWVALCVPQLPLGSTQVRTLHPRWAQTRHPWGCPGPWGWFGGSAPAGEDARPTRGVPSAPGQGQAEGPGLEQMQKQRQTPQ